jgi:hypothetical protein
MILRSNIKTVIANLERLQVEAPKAVTRAIAPKRWHKLLESSATQVLRGLASGEPNPEMREALRGYVDRVVATLTGQVISGGTLFTLKAGDDRFGFPVDMRRAMQTAQGMGDSGGELVNAQENLEAAKDMVREWVIAKKDMDRQEHQDHEAAVTAVMQILGFMTPPQNVGSYSENMRAIAKDMVEKYIQPFASERSESVLLGPLDVATAQTWLRAVLETWRDLVEAELPRALKEELKTMRTTLKTTLL